MRRFWKIFFISLGSLVGLLLLTIGVALAIVFTPSRITPIVQRVANDNIKCEVQIERVELTFFSTFPHFGLRADGIKLLNPMEGAQSDTLLNIKNITCEVNLMAFLRRNELNVSHFELSDGYINAFTNDAGQSNFDIFENDTNKQDTTSSFALTKIDVRETRLLGVNLRYLTPKINAELNNLTADIGATMDGDSARLNLSLDWHSATFEADGKRFIAELPMTLTTALRADTKNYRAHIDTLALKADAVEIYLSGEIAGDSTLARFATDLEFSLKPISTDDARRLGKPFLESIEQELRGMKFSAIVEANGTLRGEYDSTQMPIMDGRIALTQGSFSAKLLLPVPINRISLVADAHLDLNNEANTYVGLRQFRASTPKSEVSITGQLTNLLDNFAANISVLLDADIEEVTGFLPNDIDLAAYGHLSGNIAAKFTLAQLTAMKLDKMQASGYLTFTDLAARMDSLNVNSDKLNIALSLPVANPRLSSAGLLGAIISSNSLKISEGSDTRADIAYLNLDVQTSDPRLASPAVSVAWSSGAIAANIAEETIVLERLSLTTSVKYDPAKTDFFEKYFATGSLDLQNLAARLSILPDKKTEIGAMRLNFTPSQFNIAQSDIRLGNSDFHLTGKLTNIVEYFRKQATLSGDFTFSSNHTDLAELMLITSGLGGSEQSDTTAIPAPAVEQTEPAQTAPYMVPKGINVTLHTDIKQAQYGVDNFSNVRGDVYVKDGVLMLDRLRVTTPAAKLQVSAQYRSQRENHLFLGLDLHLMEVDIHRLPTMIPGLDTLMPMLNSFEGLCEFHVAGESYLFANYSPKMSTIRVAGSIKGKNLVLIDGETFSEIAKYLMFNKQTRNRVDSLSVEFTIFRNEIDIYPFLISIDQYKAVVAGRHNLDMTFDYNIELVESPLPFRLAVDVYGNLDKLKFRLADAKYPDFYRPARRGVVESEQMKLRNLIRAALVGNVVREED